MKKLFIILLILVGLNIYSQTSYKVYIPMRTYHWDRSELSIKDYHNTEGGNVGAILIRHTEKNGMYFQQHLGIVKNSYFNTSVIAQVGFGFVLKEFNIGTSVGIASGYHKVYEITDTYIPEAQKMPGVLKNNGLLPTTMITISYNKYKIKPTINISPTFINGGIIFNIKNNYLK